MTKIIEKKKEEREAAAAASPAGQAWIVVVAKVGQERRVKHELEVKGFEVYLPMALSMNRKSELVARPFFPRYVFARLTLAVERWQAIYTTMGVAGVLGGGEQPTGIRDTLVQAIRDREEAGFIKIGLAEEASFEPGARVREAVYGLEGIFEERVDDRRASILVSFMGRDSRFTVDLRTLKASASGTT